MTTARVAFRQVSRNSFELYCPRCSRHLVYAQVFTSVSCHCEQMVLDAKWLPLGETWRRVPCYVPTKMIFNRIRSRT